MEWKRKNPIITAKQTSFSLVYYCSISSDNDHIALVGKPYCRSTICILILDAQNFNLMFMLPFLGFAGGPIDVSDIKLAMDPGYLIAFAFDNSRSSSRYFYQIWNRKENYSLHPLTLSSCKIGSIRNVETRVQNIPCIRNGVLQVPVRTQFIRKIACEEWSLYQSEKCLNLKVKRFLL